jgi:ABC-type nitrate/sulfonate/bicarbonate transport system substrate-binding protein
MTDSTRIRPRRRTFLKSVGLVSVGGGLAGCLSSESGGGGQNTTTKSAEKNPNGKKNIPTFRYAGIPKTQLNDLNLLFLQSSYMRKNVLPNLGKNYDVKIVTVQGTPLVVSALGAGEADAGILAYSSFANATASNTIKSGAKIIAPLTYDGPRFADTYMSKPDSGVSKIPDLEGKSLGVNAIGSAIDIAARVALRQNDVDPNRVQFRELSFGAIPAALEKGRIDAGTFIQPFFSMNAQKFEPVFTTQDAFGSFLKIFITVRNDFLNQHPDVVKYWMEDYWAGMKWWADDANSEKRLDIAEKIIGLPRDLLKQLVQTEKGYYHGEEGLAIDPKLVQKPVDGMQQVGYLKQKLQMNQYVDGSYLPNEANKKPKIK